MSIVLSTTGTTTVRVITEGNFTGTNVIGSPYGTAYLLRRLSVLANFDSLALQSV
ncbi:MAG: hypothetical protein KAX57_00995 [Rhodoferax sp.]|jgi:hypothetical protein|uniref:hypothetical protein n=1 Tax=Rhodoferax sp. TaxID=50421 RepID=UPI001B4B2FDE|nr:hypothetical protein [Rhodoferax sp.]MBP8285395.1 hypothetical protein [Rhodoferax sp.]MBP9148711.1 hypothetical protein [Rhodoferax sp.]MBP9736255.1 hypothetical protein [Rhodoferax sp.]